MVAFNHCMNLRSRRDQQWYVNVVVDNLRCSRMTSSYWRTCLGVVVVPSTFVPQPDVSTYEIWSSSTHIETFKDTLRALNRNVSSNHLEKGRIDSWSPWHPERPRASYRYDDFHGVLYQWHKVHQVHEHLAKAISVPTSHVGRDCNCTTLASIHDDWASL